MCTYAGINRSLLNSSRKRCSQQAEYDLGISVTYMALCDDEKKSNVKKLQIPKHVR